MATVYNFQPQAVLVQPNKSELAFDNRWSSGFCGCCDDCKSCCCALWCWPCFQCCYLDQAARVCLKPEFI